MGSEWRVLGTRAESEDEAAIPEERALLSCTCCRRGVADSWGLDSEAEGARLPRQGAQRRDLQGEVTGPGTCVVFHRQDCKLTL